MLLNARKVFYEGNGHTTILLGFEDATERRRTERALQKLLEQKEMLLSEMSHRVANSPIREPPLCRRRGHLYFARSVPFVACTDRALTLSHSEQQRSEQQRI